MGQEAGCTLDSKTYLLNGAQSLNSTQTVGVVSKQSVSFNIKCKIIRHTFVRDTLAVNCISETWVDQFVHLI